MKGKTSGFGEGVGEWGAQGEPAARLVGTFTFLSLGTTHWPCNSISHIQA